MLKDNTVISMLSQYEVLTFFGFAEQKH